MKNKLTAGVAAVPMFGKKAGRKAPSTGSEDGQKDVQSGTRTRLALIVLLTIAIFSPSALRAQLVVDCSGANPNAFPTINSALAAVPGPGATILVSGVCTEDVALNNQLNLNLGAWWGTTATLHGHLSINTSESVYLYGLNVTNASGNGVDVVSGRGITLDTFTSTGNSGIGLSLGNTSDVNVIGPAAFDNNSSYGIDLFTNSMLTFGTWNGSPIEINNNKNAGLYLSQASFTTFGNTYIIGNASSAAGTPAFGLTQFGGSRVQIGTCSGPNAIEQNQSGGISVVEHSEITLWSCNQGFRSTVQNNGAVGISVGFGSQVTIYDDVDIIGHAGPGIDIYSNGQLYFFGQNVVSQNGVPGDPRSAAIRLDGNSQAFMRGGQIASNLGVGILALVNSSADFTGLTFSGNSAGTITCDTSSWMASDLPTHSGVYGPGVSCRTPHTLGPRSFAPTKPPVPDFSLQKKRQAQYKATATPKSH
jgi:hypothetical protein